MFKSLLIANRGEIACRVIRTAQKMGITTIAVYSDADKQALHVHEADQAIHIGAAPAVDSYLDGQKILQRALAAGAEAIHPGYGFLSENAAFAEACQSAGIVFVGPGAEAMRAMGSKSAAKTLMESAGVPLVPGYHGDNQDVSFLSEAARECGYPLMLKASAGGGGKGMRIVESDAEFADALAAVKRESRASFGDDQVLLERYLQNPKHIEIQVFGDSHGHYVHLFERDCSLQRRHQKIIEEAPAPGMTSARRHSMGEAAISAAKAIQYEGAGTIEFIVDTDIDAGWQFYFMEMNTRLQVEHPVTEMITGIDLVEWQLRVASGEVLPATQDDLRISGHSVEVRVYAENTDNGFLPASGVLSLVEFPLDSDDLRIDAGVATDNEVSVHYDPMIAKIISHAETRPAAINRLHRALDQTRMHGVTTNIPYLKRILQSDAFVAAEIDTGFVERHSQALASAPVTQDEIALSKVLAAVYIANSAVSMWLTQASWATCDGWRLNTPNITRMTLCDQSASGETLTTVELTIVSLVQQSNQTAVTIDGDTYTLDDITLHGRTLGYAINDKRAYTEIIVTDNAVSVYLNGGRYDYRLIDRDLTAATSGHDNNGMRSPMPGKIIKVMVAPGDNVITGDPLLILEAMKMEHTITAANDGVVKTVFFEAGDGVIANAQLLVIE